MQRNESYLSSRYHELLGYKPGELTGTYEEWINQLHPEDRSYVSDIWQRHVKAHEPYNLEYRMRTKSGSYRWFQANGQALWDDGGRPILMAGSIADINERKQINEALQESRNLIRTVLDATPVRIFWKDLNLQYLGCNQSFALDAGLHSPDEIIGKDDYQMGWKEQAELYRSDDKQVIMKSLRQRRMVALYG